MIHLKIKKKNSQEHVTKTKTEYAVYIYVQFFFHMYCQQVLPHILLNFCNWNKLQTEYLDFSLLSSPSEPSEWWKQFLFRMCLSVCEQQTNQSDQFRR